MVKSALIIGCGYVGTALAHLWHAQGTEIIATTTRPERLQEIQHTAAKAVMLQGSDLDTMLGLLNGVECVVMTVAANSPESYHTTYLDTAETLKKALELSPHITQVIYTSSTSVYGERQGEWVDEEAPLTPSNPKTEILAKAEEVLLSSATPHRRVCILRLGEIIGPDRSIPDRIGQRLTQLFPGTGQNYTNIIHRDDVARAIAFAAEKKLTGVYNLCNDLHIPRKVLYDTICDTLDWPMVKWDGAQRTTHGGNKRVNSDKIRSAGFTFLYPDLKAVWA